MVGKRGGRWLPGEVAWEGRDRHRWAGRLAAAGIASGAVLAVLGLPPVDLHGPQHYAGVMGPFCGATRGMHAAMQGHFGEAWRYNPLSVVLVVGAVAVLLREATGRIFGRWLNLRMTRGWPVAVACLALLAALSARQQTHVDLLRTGPGPEALWYFAALPTTAFAVAAVALAWVRTRRRPGLG